MNLRRRTSVEGGMRAIAVAFAIATLSAGVAAADTEHVSRSFTLPATGGELQLNTFSGHVRITGGAGRQVTINATRSGSRDQLDAIKLNISQEGSTVVVEANQRERSWFTWWGRRDVVDTDFDITVPRQTAVALHVFSSAVDVSGVDGDLNVHTFSAPIQLADVAGPVTVHSFSGSIAIRARAFADDHPIAIDTFSGNVDLRVPDQAHAVADFRSFSGRLTSALPLLLRSTSRRNTTAELEGPGPAGRIRVKTFSGNFTVER